MQNRIIGIVIGVLVIICYTLSLKLDASREEVDKQKIIVENLKVDNAKKSSMIASLNKDNIVNNEIIKKNQEEINQLKLKSDIVQEQLSESIKKSQCANINLPDDVVNLLRSKADGVNQQADTSQPNTARDGKTNKAKSKL